ncbi:MAG: hypothetical protein K2K26_06640 [Muribaculaceae bacterium]|nr:hypothetical protein [Muribaculaceae bacterium]
MNNFTKSVTFVAASFFVVAATASTVSEVRTDRVLSTATGFEKIGRKGENPAAGRRIMTPPVLHQHEQENVAKAPAKASQEPTVIVDEDFSLWTEGTEDDPVWGKEIPGFYVNPDSPWDINPDLTHQPGWAGTAVYEAGEICGLCYPNYGGYIQTPQGDYSGQMTISLKAKICESETSKNPFLFVSVLKGNWDYGSMVSSDSSTDFKIPNDGEWHEFEWTYDNKYGGTDCFIQLNSYYEMLIDDVKVVSRITSLPHPLTMEATDFTIDGFTANWGEVGNATDYLLTCWRDLYTSTEPMVYNESFEGINNVDGVIDMADPNFPEGWGFDFADGTPVVFTPEDGIEGQALCLNANKQSITTPYTGSIITSATLNIRYMSEPIVYIDEETGEVLFKDYPGHINVEGFDGYQWKNLFYNYFVDGSETQFYDYDYTDYVAGKYYQIRIVTSGFSDGVEVAIDDFCVTTLPFAEKEYVCNDKSVEGTSYTFTGLDPYSDYYYYVKANNTDLGITSGDPVAGTFAFGVSAPEVSKATNVDIDAYTANWERTPKAQEYMVENIRVFTADEDIADYPVIEETFEKCIVNATPENPVVFNNPYIMSLNDYCDNYGWTGYLCGIAYQAVGGIGLSQYGIGGEIQTPYLTLGNNGGKFKMSVSVCGTYGDYLYIVTSSGVGGAIALSDEYETYVAEFEGGNNFDYIAFYTAYKTPFFIDYFEITQDLKAGDKVYTIIDEARTDETEWDFYDLEQPGGSFTYGYDVFGIHTFLTNTAWSKRSEVMLVDFNNGVEKVTDESVAIVKALDKAIEVTTAEGANVEIFNVSGIRTAAFSGSKTVSAECGLYLVVVDGKTFKVVVR